MGKISALPIAEPSENDKVVASSDFGTVLLPIASSSGSDTASTTRPYIFQWPANAYFLDGDAVYNGNNVYQMSTDRDFHNQLYLNAMSDSSQSICDFNDVEHIFLNRYLSGKNAYLYIPTSISADYSIGFENLGGVQKLLNAKETIETYNISLNKVFNYGVMNQEEVKNIIFNVYELKENSSYDLHDLFRNDQYTGSYAFLYDDKKMLNLLCNASDVSGMFYGASSSILNGFMQTQNACDALWFKNITSSEKAKGLFNSISPSSAGYLYLPGFNFNMTGQDFKDIYSLSKINFNYGTDTSSRLYIGKNRYTQLGTGPKPFAVPARAATSKDTTYYYLRVDVYFKYGTKFVGDCSGTFEGNHTVEVQSGTASPSEATPVYNGGWTCVDFSEVTKLDRFFKDSNDLSTSSVSGKTTYYYSGTSYGSSNVSNFLSAFSSTPPDFSSLQSSADMFNNCSVTDFSRINSWSSAPWFAEKSESGALDHMFRSTETVIKTYPSWATDAMKN